MCMQQSVVHCVPIMYSPIGNPNRLVITTFILWQISSFVLNKVNKRLMFLVLPCRIV